MIAGLIILFLATFGGGCLGWVLREWRYAEHAALLSESVRDGTSRVYSTTADGRSADRYEPGRYADGQH